ncbi:MAG TPA: alpha/beta fold hydrolase [Myxococcota bacterium]|jgi:hypothetical protein
MTLYAHAQTVTATFPTMARAPAGLVSETLELALVGGGALVALAEWQPRTAPAALIIHGVAGSSDDAYVVRAARALSRRGFHTVRVNQRGSGRGSGKAPVLYHAGLSDDVQVVRAFLEARSDVSSVVLLGFSLGGHVALAHACDVAGDDGRLAAVCTVSAPVDLAATLAQFEKNANNPFGRIYERLIVKSLATHARALPGTAFSVAELDSIVSIRAFDHLITCRSHGFVDVADYHAKASVAPRLSRITVPTLMIHAADDPVVPAAPLAHITASSSTELVVLPRGGHVGFAHTPAQWFGASHAVLRALAHFERHAT